MACTRSGSAPRAPRARPCAGWNGVHQGARPRVLHHRDGRLLGGAARRRRRARLRRGRAHHRPGAGRWRRCRGPRALRCAGGRRPCLGVAHRDACRRRGDHPGDRCCWDHPGELLRPFPGARLRPPGHQSHRRQGLSATWAHRGQFEGLSADCRAWVVAPDRADHRNVLLHRAGRAPGPGRGSPLEGRRGPLDLCRHRPGSPPGASRRPRLRRGRGRAGGSACRSGAIRGHENQAGAGWVCPSSGTGRRGWAPPMGPPRCRGRPGRSVPGLGAPAPRCGRERREILPPAVWRVPPVKRPQLLLPTPLSQSRPKPQGSGAHAPLPACDRRRSRGCWRHAGPRGGPGQPRVGGRRSWVPSWPGSRWRPWGHCGRRALPGPGPPERRR
jgi:hypothetical protein